MQRKDSVPGGFGLLVAPLLFGLYLSFFVDEPPADGAAPAAAEQQRYDVWLRCPDDVVQQERLYARSPGHALASAERLNPDCEALAADRRGSG